MEPTHAIAQNAIMTLASTRPKPTPLVNALYSHDDEFFKSLPDGQLTFVSVLLAKTNNKQYPI